MNIEDIDHYIEELDSPVYILIAGGIAAGKSTAIEKHIKSVPIMDVDSTMQELGFSNYTEEEFGEAMEIISSSISAMMQHKESLIAMGTSSNLNFTINKLLGAKMKGYTTILVHIDNSVRNSVANNEKRIAGGGRGKTVTRHKIKKTTVDARRTVAVVRETDLVDHFVYVNNT